MADRLLASNEEHRKKAKELQDLARRVTAEVQAEHHAPAVRFTLEPGEPDIFHSKAGGTPYLPHDMPWPLDGRGVGMNLLAQVDCDMRPLEEGGDLVIWGDAGVGNFFISRDALRRRDFSRVMYTWDCG